MIDLFGFPIGNYKINPNNYDKEKIITDIIHNYEIDSNRNSWDKVSHIHQQTADEGNDKFREIDYSSLLPLYDEKIREYLSNFKFKRDYRYTFKIANYTCSGKEQFMNKHIHSGCVFSAVHYIKFKKGEHIGTKFHNRHSHIDYITTLSDQFTKIKDTNDIANSWALRSWTFETEEDDICFSPATLMHSVPKQESDNLRMTIAVNIDIHEKE